LEMEAAVTAAVADCQLFIGCAAVADFRPASCANDKIKKQSSDEQRQLTLVANPDIIAGVAALAKRPFVVGFAAETSQVLDYARAKRLRKKLDLIVANDVSVDGLGFNSDRNAVTLIGDNGEESIPAMAKSALAEQLISRILDQMQNAGARP